MWTLIVLGLVFLGWYIMSPQGEAGAVAEAAPASDAPEAPSVPAPAEDNATTDGSEFTSAQAAPAPAAEAPAQAESGGSGDDDPFKAPGS